MPSMQDEIQRAFAPFQHALTDINIDTMGQEVQTFLFDMVYDKYKNKEYTMVDYKPITCMVAFPGQEVPTFPSGQSNAANEEQALHLYSILPIKAWFKAEDKARIQNMIMFRVKGYENNMITIILQILDFVSRGTVSDIVYQEAIVAPPTNNAILQSPEYITLKEKFEKEISW